MDYYNEIKERLINNEIIKRKNDYSKNKNDLETYYDVGRIIIEAEGGESLIKEYSKRLTLELGKGYNLSALKRMKKFYLIIQKGAILSHLSTWSHYVELLRFDNINQINYYVNISTKQNLSVRELRYKIKNKEYERLGYEAKNKLVNKEDIKVQDLIKNSYNYENISEKLLKKIILENMDNFLKELGNGFCYIENEYKIKLGDSYNYIDLLLFNIKFNCYVVVELKATELKKEHISQIETYMNYVDINIKTIYQDKTIGIIICKKENKYIMEYCSDDRIYNTVYNLV